MNIQEYIVSYFQHDFPHVFDRLAIIFMEITREARVNKESCTKITIYDPYITLSRKYEESLSKALQLLIFPNGFEKFLRSSLLLAEK